MAWQRQRFPHPWCEQIKVIFDGVDTNLFACRLNLTFVVNKSGTNGRLIEILTLCPCSLMPRVAWSLCVAFQISVLQLCSATPGLHVVAGDDRIAYSYGSSISLEVGSSFLKS